MVYGSKPEHNKASDGSQSKPTRHGSPSLPMLDRLSLRLVHPLTFNLTTFVQTIFCSISNLARLLA